MRTQVMLIASMAAGGCSFSSSAKPTDAGAIDTPAHDGSADAMIDGAPDAAQQDFGTGVWTVHVPTLPTSGVTLPAMIDTGPASPDCMTTAMWTDPSQPDSCFIVGTTIDTSADVKARGPRPLVLVATDALIIDKHLEVASHRGQPGGAGASWSGCGMPMAGTSLNQVGGGGAGGTYITVGGSGGAGDNGQAAAGLASNTPLAAPAILHGGCPGSDSGAGTGGAARGASGGGAVYLVAGRQITISGLVNASGASPTGSGKASGGAGAGSGGTIVLYAPSIIATGGTLMANGGGGGGGGDNNTAGTVGGDPMMATPTAQAAGGAGPNGPAGGGGPGFSTMGGASVGMGGNSGEGGGGGGGGAGYIRSNVTLDGAIASPAVDVVP